ncbi:hypothetical protein LEP1GSC170_4402 [Leptospira interrogans serovar Bataviae str. HAI135]|nr:hypothetical protein LEP1GSC170_4402 [Leptospira interrogans serovar Bataviae str. HAI135]
MKKGEGLRENVNGNERDYFFNDYDTSDDSCSSRFSFSFGSDCDTDLVAVFPDWSSFGWIFF